jgi:glycosyltransferase involved in cell wall biosynthesis
MIVVSESTKQNLIQMKLPEKKLHVIFNGVDDAVYKLLMEKSPNPLVLYLGRIMKYKNIDHLIEIFSSTSRRIENSRMIIVGTGPELENIRRLVKDSDLEDKILVRGYVSLEEKIELLNHAWVIVSASMREGWSLTAIEAAACGTPTVAYNVLGLRDSVRDGETGLLVPYGDKSRFAEVLIKILTDPTLRARLSENALNWSNNYRWDVAAKAFLEVCESATSPKHI